MEIRLTAEAALYHQEMQAIITVIWKCQDASKIPFKKYPEASRTLIKSRK